MGVYKLIGPVRTLAFVSLFALTAGGCAITGTSKDLVTPPATLVPATKTGLVLDNLPPPRQKLDVAVYNFPDLTGQNKSNDNFAEFSRAVTQGGSSILTAATGGTLLHFRKQRQLEDAIADLGIQLRSGYLLSYYPNSKESGYHTVKVEVDLPGAKVYSRPGYWLNTD